MLNNAQLIGIACVKFFKESSKSMKNGWIASTKTEYCKFVTYVILLWTEVKALDCH